MNIASILRTETIELNMTAATKEEAIAKMAALVGNAGFLSDQDQYVKDVLIREGSSSTGIGFGVAIPHGKSSGVKSAALAFAKFAEPVEWASMDGQPVTMAFLIGVPVEQAGQEHLKILTTLARKLIHESFRQTLTDAASAEDVLKALDF
ncbi:PTS sugar transporter subunit IIA [Paenibacillus mucilaginosus]|uniref:PTS fructose transporter subunit IIA n=3 Tax=Paenibacillus mucilaginosus TaxID=61624 RepID=I0BDF6_9BACL|nr:fructose PTS transporter subunit IIA [Paenibacillus mucilaginosus]AEI41969.1 putative PTS IIA-like nitrogen-regulatory protein PtsN [Paenibacillus mucilaginosus KNP414]AFC28230.1 putative PTS IIA-like nitrogen-regulatory protein PtsN [Paenibacillus mucilaginosus 3016]AFH60403.1 PTS fructose transporter subunit IIA [Paenibacillus mucilaginosus K02]MCG7217845.1 fructose PTS transporter subunit IIA [Paenibacillus mucilaginosus]WDM28875.1 fructose PTS transporter subunit IIA [Paenibacillus muci